MKRILMVKVESEYREQLSNRLRRENYSVIEVDTPIKGIEKIAQEEFDVVISGVDLPIMSGIEFIQSVKNINEKIVCVILTDQLDDDLEIQCLNQRIDLYLEKGKSLEVIVNYINKLSSSVKLQNDKMFKYKSTCEDIVIDEMKNQVIKSRKLVDLTPKEIKILKIFLENKNTVISRDEFIKRAWEEPEDDVDRRLVDSHIKRLREKLKSRAIVTVRGYGYRWDEL